jgi:PII-like signaling protein
MQQGQWLQFYTHELHKHHGMVLYEWLLEQAHRQGIAGGSAFRAIAGFGRRGVLHEEHFFELAGDLPVRVEFLVTHEEAARLLAALRAESVRLFYVQMPAEFGILGD